MQVRNSTPGVRHTVLSITVVAGLLCLLLPTTNAAAQETYRMRIQAAVASGAMSYEMLERFAQRLKTMSGGRLEVELYSAGALVPSPRILDAVNDGTVEAGFAWPQYWAGKHPAASLFSNTPVWAMAGLDSLAHLSWMYEGGGLQMYEKLLRDEIGVDVVPVFVTPSGWQPLGWFNKPVESWEQFKQLSYRSPPGLAGEIYEEAGANVTFLTGEEIVPSAERGVIDGAEWLNPLEDMSFGLHDAFDYYYLSTVHQFMDLGEVVINGDFWESLPPEFQEMIRTAAKATIVDTYNNDIMRNAEALETLRDEHDITIKPTPDDIHAALMQAAGRVLDRRSEENEFFRRVVESQSEFAKTTAPWWGEVLRMYDSLAEDAVIK
jgi:TRAP-type mannitol/chloroaromatic compound transport system substrate-binding protein